MSSLAPLPEVAVSVRGLSKSYTLSHNSLQHTTAAEAIIHGVKNLGRPQTKETFWALRDVSFEINKGDVVGVIGRNGAGKSTLLKVLSRITEPTRGQIDLYGRVGSLLEVGTGFHAELTGRENIYLNGAILGMSKREIAKHFDAIIDFSGVEQFLDTPVKRYSSGMYVRLAFAVAAHLEPEILIVDEVLAVGDAEFQKKCLGKMQDVAAHGRTVIFVSHHMQSVSLLCTKGIFMAHGQVEYTGPVQGAIDHYLGSFVGQDGAPSDPDKRAGSGEYRFTAVAPGKEYYMGDELKEIKFQIQRRTGGVGKMYLSAHIVNSKGVDIAQCDSRLINFWVDEADVLEGALQFTTPILKPGEYTITAYICTPGTVLDTYEHACKLTVSPVLPYPNSSSEDGTQFGLVFADFNWVSYAPTFGGGLRAPSPVGS